MNFIKRNAPVLIIGLITVLVFVGIIAAGQTNPPTAPVLKEVPEKDLIATHSVIKGDQNAPVTLTEFSDFGCPACAAFQPLVEKVYETCNTKLKIVYRHFPLAQHKNADKAAEAAQIAAEFGKFWEYGDILYQNQTSFERADLLSYADRLGLDTERFATALDAGTYTALVREDVAAGTKLGVSFTPTFFLNNRLMIYKDFNEFQSTVVEACANAPTPSDISLETTPSVTPTKVEIVKEATAPVVSPAELDAKYGVVNVIFTETGFNPGKNYVQTGQLMRWTNKAKTAMVLMDLYDKYPELKDTVTIEPDKSFDLRLYKKGYWMFKEKTTGKIGTVAVGEKID